LWQGEVGFRSFRHSFCAAGAVPTDRGLNYAIPVVVLLLRLWAETPIDREGRAGSENREGERVPPSADLWSGSLRSHAVGLLESEMSPILPDGWTKSIVIGPQRVTAWRVCGRVMVWDVSSLRR
jgi:hypothetical protein